MSKNPTRNYVIQWLTSRGVSAEQAAAIAAAVPSTTTTDATGSVFGDVTGALLGPLSVVGIHGDEASIALAADGDDLDLGDGRRDAFYWLIDFAGFDISGFAAPASPGEIHCVVSTGIAGRILGSSAGSAAADRVLSPSGNIAMATDAAIYIVYSGTLERWVPVGGTAVSPGVAGSFPYFNIRDYGAIDDGATDILAAVNDAIAARNAAGGGVLYVPTPASGWLTSAGFNAITTPGLILGDGRFASIIECSSGASDLFTISVDGAPVRDLGMLCSASPATAGAAVATTGGLIADIQDCYVEGFYNGFDIENMLGGIIRGNFIQNFWHYGMRGRNTSVPDAGDSSVVENLLSTNHPAASAFRWESSGGLRLIDNKVNGGGAGARATYGIDVEVGTGVVTSVGIIMGNSIENVGSHAVRLVATGAGAYGQWIIDGLQVGLYNANNAGRAIYASGAGISDLEIDNIIANTTGSAREAIELVSVADYRLGRVKLVNNFTSILTVSGATGGVDDTGSIADSVAVTGHPTAIGQVPTSTGTGVGASSTWQTPTPAAVTGFATPALTLGTVNAAGAATTTLRSDATILVFDATVPAAIGTAATGSAGVAARRDHVHPTGAGMPTTQALGDAATTGSGPAAAMTDHKHAMPALSTATPLVESGSGAVGTALPSSREDHVHPAVTSTAGLDDHIHVVGEQLTGDGATLAFLLANEALPSTVAAYVAGDRTDVTLGGANDQITFAVAPGAAAAIRIDYVPLQA